MKSITYPNTSIYISSGTTGSIITSTSITTPSINTTMIVPTTGSGSTNNVLISTGNGITWDVPSGSNITNSTLDMNTKNINNANTINCTNINVRNITSNTTFVNQTEFTSAPISIDPTNSSHLSTKQYVDSKLLDSGNVIYNLYLNKSQSETVPTGGNTGYFKLSSILTGATDQTISGVTITGGTEILAGSFITDPVNITNIPVSLFILNLYVGIFNSDAIFNLFFSLFKYSNGTVTSIGTSTKSAGSGDVNTKPNTYPDLYTMTLSISSPITLLAQDRLILRLYYISTIGTGTNYTIYFEKNYCSYLSIVVNNNPTKVKTNGFAISNLNMNNYNITSNNNLSIGCTGKTFSLGDNSISTINIGTNTTTNINLISNNGYNLNCPLTISYTNIPSTNQIGQIVTFTRPTGISNFVNNTELPIQYILPYYGKWLINVNVGIFTISPGTLTNVTLYISNNDTNEILGENEFNGSNTTQTNVTNNILNLTVSLITGTTIKSFNVVQMIKFSGGQFSISTDPYIVKALRLA
jgi:hypothetical protein